MYAAPNAPTATFLPKCTVGVLPYLYILYSSLYRNKHQGGLVRKAQARDLALLKSGPAASGLKCWWPKASPHIATV